VSVYVAMLVIVSMSGALPAPQMKTTDVVEIDGAKTPELLPEYVVWENVLSGLAMIKDKHMTLPLESLQMKPGELDRIFAAAQWYVTERTECGQKQRRQVASMREGKSPAPDIDAAQRSIILDCRQRVLDQVDTLLAGLSAESRVSLLNWVAERKGGMKSSVPKGELDFFRKPR
jgi:hypothetical protein